MRFYTFSGGTNTVHNPILGTIPWFMIVGYGRSNFNATSGKGQSSQMSIDGGPFIDILSNWTLPAPHCRPWKQIQFKGVQVDVVVGEIGDPVPSDKGSDSVKIESDGINLTAGYKASVYPSNPNDGNGATGLVVRAIPLASFNMITTTGIQGAAVTLTIPTSGYHRITKLIIEQFYAILGVAAGAPNIITSTNLNTNPSFNMEQLAQPQGTLVVRNIDFPTPIRGVVNNLSVTFVAPAQAQIIWKLSAMYYYELNSQ